MAELPSLNGFVGFSNGEARVKSCNVTESSDVALHYEVSQCKRRHRSGSSNPFGSTIISQVVMTFGGSLFPGALGSMLIEILPFLRGIASKIQTSLGDDNPDLVPTVFAAYALTSILIGAIFTILGISRCGRLVEQHMASLDFKADEKHRFNIFQRLSLLVPLVGSQKLSRSMR